MITNTISDETYNNMFSLLSSYFYLYPNCEYLVGAVFNKAVVTKQPDWLQIFRDEKITLKCEIQGGENILWQYEWRKSKSNPLKTNTNYRSVIASKSSSGEYTCKGIDRRNMYSSTEWSEAIALSVSRKSWLLCSVFYRLYKMFIALQWATHALSFVRQWKRSQSIGYLCFCHVKDWNFYLNRAAFWPGGSHSDIKMSCCEFCSVFIFD